VSQLSRELTVDVGDDIPRVWLSQGMFLSRFW